MNEDAQTYIKRLHSYVGDQEPIQVLSRTPELLPQLIRKHPGTELSELKSGKWSRTQVLAHFAEAEIVFAYRLRMIASEPGIHIQAYDQNHFMQNTQYLLQDPERAIELFQVLRKTNLAFIQHLNEAASNAYGIHEERGRETLQDVLRLYAGHDLNHLKQLD